LLTCKIKKFAELFGSFGDWNVNDEQNYFALNRTKEQYLQCSGRRRK
jgi:hypothetical protein